MVRRIAILLARISVAVVMAATLLSAAGVLYARSQGMLMLSVQTGSMRPAIRPGDVVLAGQRDTDMKHLRTGQIVSYHSLEHPDVIITHRIVSIDAARGLVTTKGDALVAPDPSFTSDRIVGVVDHSIPMAGFALDFVRHPAGLIVAVYTPSLLLIIWEIRRLMKYYAHQHYQVYYY